MSLLRAPLEPGARAGRADNTGAGDPSTGSTHSTGSPARTGWSGALRQIAIGLAVFGVYLAVTHGLRPSPSASAGHGRQLLSAERWLHIDCEQAMDRWLAGHWILGDLAAWEYAISYIVTTFGVAFWVYFRRPAAFRWSRNLLIGSTVIALAVFALWPAAPPRLLPGYPDVVAMHHPFLSWGSGTVSAGADTLAAMPSLHVGWAVWVSIVTLHPAVRTSRVGPAAVALAALHLAITALVVLATGNHFVLDVAGGVLVVIGPALAGLAWSRRPRHRRSGTGRRRSQRIAAPDAFFLHVESDTVPQHVGGVAVLDTTGRPGGPPIEDFRKLLADRLAELPRLSARIVARGTFRAPRWEAVTEIDLDHHLVEHTLPAPGGRRALEDYVGRLAQNRLPLDRPPWQVHVIRGVSPTEMATVAVMHHAIADGLGVVDILRQLMDPCLPPPEPPAMRPPPAPVRAGLALVGIVQLALDGAAPPTEITGPSSPSRRYRTVALPLADLQVVARAIRARVTDVMLSLLGDVLAEILVERGRPAPPGSSIRVAVPITLRPPAPPGTGRTAVPGNLTAAVRLDVPIDRRDPLSRLELTGRSAERRRRSPRPLGSTAVMHGLALLPGVLQERAARAMYRDHFFGAIATNMPGPAVQLSLAGLPMLDVYPIVPLAERVPVSIGTLGWNGLYCLSALTDPELLPELDDAGERFVAAFRRLTAAAGAAAGRMVRAPASGEAAAKSGRHLDIAS